MSFLKERILVTGCSGFVGSHLTKKLDSYKKIGIDINNNIEITKLYDKFYKFDLSNISDPYVLNDLKKFSGVFIHLAAARSDRESIFQYKKNNIEATTEILKILNPTTIKFFVHISSVAAIDGRELETSGAKIIGSDDWYRHTKYEQEKIITEWCVSNNIKLLILAPSAIYTSKSRKDTNIGRLQKISKLLPIIPSIEIKKSLTNIDDLIKEIINHLEGKETINKIPKMRLVIDNPVYTVSQHMDIIKNKKLIKIKFPFLKQTLIIISHIIEFLKMENHLPLTRNRVEKLFKDTGYSGQKIYLD
jgi:UDP-glucuronate 4-epimerase